MKLIFLVLLFPLASHSLGSKGAQCKYKDTNISDLVDISKDACEKVKSQEKCQNLYKEIKENGKDIEDYALKCDSDPQSARAEAFAVSAFGCISGGVVGGIIDPLNSLGESLGKGLANLKNMREQQGKIQQYCNEHPEMKMQMITQYNDSVPNLLKLDVPKDLNAKSCSALSEELYFAADLKSNQARNKFTERQRRMNPNYVLTDDDKEYLAWQKSKDELAGKDDSSLFQKADAALDHYGVSIECYNKQARWYLRCEVAFDIATVAVGGYGVAKASLAAISGLKVARFTKTVGEVAENNNGSLRNLSAVDKDKILTQASKLSDKERVSAAEKLTGRQLTEKQKRAVIDAHNVGAREGRDFRSYTPQDLDEKAKILRSAGFNKSEIDKLMRSGTTGKFADPKQEARFIEYQNGFSKATKEKDKATYERLQAEVIGKEDPEAAKKLYESATKRLVNAAKNDPNYWISSRNNLDLISVASRTDNPANQEVVREAMKRYVKDEYKGYQKSLESKRAVERAKNTGIYIPEKTEAEYAVEIHRELDESYNTYLRNGDDIMAQSFRSQKEAVKEAYKLNVR